MILYISGGKLRASWRSRRTSFLAGSCAMSIHRRIHKEGGLQPDNQNFKKCEHHFLRRNTIRRSRNSGDRWMRVHKLLSRLFCDHIAVWNSLMGRNNGKTKEIGSAGIVFQNINVRALRSQRSAVLY